MTSLRTAAVCCVCAMMVLSLPATSSAQTEAQEQVPGLSEVFKQTAIDFTRLGSRSSFIWLTGGAAVSILGHGQDSTFTRSLSQPRFTETFEPGQLIGSLPVQLGGAFAAYSIGRVTGKPRIAIAGSELIRAQLVAQTVTWGAKYAFQRTRPDGTTLSFPSGHTAVTFATATVLQRNFGWRVGLPAYGVASYVAASRIQMKRHYFSDVAFGAAIGILSGHTVSVGRGSARFAVSPTAAPGGGGVSFTLLGKH